MKLKLSTITLAAMACVLTSAFTLRKTEFISNTHVWIKQTSSDNFICTQISIECFQHIPGQLCMVVIVKSSGAIEGVAAYDANCTVQLRHSEGANYAGLLDAGIGDRPYDVANTSQ